MAVIDAPQLPPLLFNKNGKYTYVCTYKNHWDPKLGRAVRTKGENVTVGKILDGELTGRIIWSESFIKQFPILSKLKTERVVDKFKSKGKLTRYKLEFSQADDLDDIEDNTLFIRRAKALRVVHAGATWLLDQVVADTPLSKALKATFNTYNMMQKLLSFAYFKVIEPEKAMYLYEDFALSTRLPFHRPLDIGSITRTLQHIDSTKLDKFFVKLNEFSIQEEEKDKDTVYYALDSTSISTCAKELDFSEWGHNKDGDLLKQINIVMMVNQKTGCPLYYRVYSGATPDVSTVAHLLKEYCRMGFNRRAILVADRGYGSVKNIHHLYQDNQSFLFNMRTCFSICKNLIVKYLSYLLDDCNFNLTLGQSVATEKIKWSYPLNCNTNTSKARLKGDMYVHIYLNHDLRNSAEETFRTTLAKALDKKKTDEGNLTKEEKDFLKKYTFTDDNGNVRVSNTAKFEYMLRKGIRVLVSDIISDPVEADRAYRERNEVELGFRKLKDFTGARRLHISSSKTLTGKIFVHFLASSILCMLRSKVDNAIDNGKKLPYESAVKMLSSLSNVTQTIFPEGGYFSEVVGKKKELLKALDVSLPEAEMDVVYEEDELVEHDDELENSF